MTARKHSTASRFNSDDSSFSSEFWIGLLVNFTMSTCAKKKGHIS
jgi:hypothetical protein